MIDPAEAPLITRGSKPSENNAVGGVDNNNIDVLMVMMAKTKRRYDDDSNRLQIIIQLIE